MWTETGMRIYGPNAGREIQGIEGLEQPSEGAEGAEAGAFTRELGKAIQELDQVQLDADQQADVVARGGGNLHELAIAMEKADISMRLALKVRNKAVETYNEIMRMTV
jgi:flagellar hook-basal body complex protein FliE